jgi:peptidoglycan/xylan/chitin deacetylase (PgdA/CDA1 family)
VNVDERRSARLLFARELAAGRVGERDLDRAEVRRVVRAVPTPPFPVRVGQRLAMRRGLLGYVESVVEPFMKARRAVLGDDAAGPPRLLVRVDEFPHWRAYDEPRKYGTERFQRFHELLAEAGVPYLIAVVARPSHAADDPRGTGERPLDDGEREMLRRAAADGAAFGVHGLTHRTRRRIHRRKSELAGLSAGELDARLDTAQAALDEVGIEAPVFVPPWNRFGPRQYGVLARRFEVVCGGDQTVMALGHQRTPLWRGPAVYLPSYAPAAEHAGPVAELADDLARREASVVVPVCLHWGWEAEDDFASLRRAVRTLAQHAAPWPAFLDDVRRTRELPAPVP